MRDCSVIVQAAAISSCFGSTAATLDALATGKDGTAGLTECVPFRVPGVEVVYANGSLNSLHYAERAEAHLRCAWSELADRGELNDLERSAIIACSGLGATPVIESGHGRSNAAVIRDLLVDSEFDVPIYSLTNACSVSGMGCRLAALLLSSGVRDQVILVAADSMSRSMLTMIGKVAPTRPATRCQPFDRDRRGAVLGEGAAICVLSLGRGGAGLGSVLATAVSTDAAHLTAPDAQVIEATVAKALELAGCDFADLDLVIPHGTGTEMNDRTEIQVYRRWSTKSADVTFSPLKGLLGHTSGASFLMSLIVALHSLGGEQPCAVSAPHTPMDDAQHLRFSSGERLSVRRGLSLVSAYGFGGVNAVAVVQR